MANIVVPASAETLRAVRQAWLLAILINLLPLIVPHTAFAVSRGGRQPITVGSVSLTPCQRNYAGYCGSITRPLDPSGLTPGTLVIGFEWYPQSETGSPNLGTIIAQEGGPGYSTTGSRDGYIRLFTPLRTQRNILLVDKRGTGESSPLHCPTLQRSKRAGLGSVKTCATSLGVSAWYFGTALAADDVAAVIQALGLAKVDYYGDSYGTYFGQVFAVRHPGLLRTVVLDSAYPVLGQNPWFATEIETGPNSLNLVCSRSPSCGALGGSSLARFDALLTSLRATPVSGTAPGMDGEAKQVTADAGALFTIFYNAGDWPDAYRDLDAAGRAWLDNGDALPLLRLVAEAEDGNTLSGGIAFEFNPALYTAVFCSDYAQVFSMSASLAERRTEYLQNLAIEQATDPTVYAPFTLKEGAGAPTDPEGFNICLVWPEPPPDVTPGAPVAANTAFPKVPVLVLSGEIDTITSPIEGAETAALFPTATYLLVPNGIHETAIGDGGVFVPPNGADLAECVGPIVLAFVGSGGNPGDTSCLQQIRPIRTVPVFARSFTEVASAAAMPGNQVNVTGLELASAAAETVGDALARYFVTVSGSDSGLRGGSFTIQSTPTGYDLDLQALQWTEDLAVTGSMDWNQGTGDIGATVSLAAKGHSGTVKISWNDRDIDAVATLTGIIDGQVLQAQRIAP